MIDMPRSFGIDGREAQEIFDKIGLTANCNSIPDDKLPPFRPSGLRLGTPAITTRGLKEKDMQKIADWMKRSIESRNSLEDLEKIREEVVEFSKKFPLPSDN